MKPQYRPGIPVNVIAGEVTLELGPIKSRGAADGINKVTALHPRELEANEAHLAIGTACVPAS